MLSPMARDHSIQRYRHWYARLLHLYPKLYRERFAEPMEQTFNDLLQDRAKEGRELLVFTLFIFVETLAGILREQTQACFMKSRNIAYIALGTAFILLIPLIAMRFTKEVSWTLFDFVFAGILIFSAGCFFEMARRKAAGNIPYKLGAGMALAAVFLLIWINGAVGFIGSENNPVNLMYAGVIGIAVVGSLIARLRPHGMVRALVATAIAQAMVPVIALLVQPHAVFGEPPGVIGVFALNLFFVVLFAGSALLFRRAQATGSVSRS